MEVDQPFVDVGALQQRALLERSLDHDLLEREVLFALHCLPERHTFPAGEGAVQMEEVVVGVDVHDLGLEGGEELGKLLDPRVGGVLLRQRKGGSLTDGDGVDGGGHGMFPALATVPIAGARSAVAPDANFKSGVGDWTPFWVTLIPVLMGAL